MPAVTEPFREEHHLMLPQIEKLRVVADCVGEFSRDHLQRSIDVVYDFLAHSLIPHAAADEAVKQRPSGNSNTDLTALRSSAQCK